MKEVPPLSTLAYTAIISERTQSGRQPHSNSTIAPKFEARGLNFWYGASHTLHDISIQIPERSVMALIGPSGCGKSTFLRLLNRMNDLIEGTRHTGQILLNGQDIY